MPSALSDQPDPPNPETTDKNETSRFLGEGVSFKAKLIGILEVSEARGDRMCQEALADLKMAIRAAGEHKQRITINVAIDGLRLRDEKTGDSLYHHPVHKISFIAQDMSDSRAFGYIFGSPDTGHRFFGIKTDKAASQVVIAMRDLFQVVFALKKKEIELAKQHLDKSRYSTSPLFSERNLNSKSNLQDASNKSSESKGATALSAEQRSAPAVADLVDLELELNSLQQGLTQMERITPSDPFGRSEDPFGDSFTSFSKAILPPPPSSGRDRSTRVSESSSIFSPKTPHTVGGASCDSSSAADLFNTSRDTPKDFSFNEFNSSHDEPSSGDWFTPPAGNSLFEDAPSSLLASTATISEKDRQHEQAKHDILSQFDVFTELDPLGTKTYQTNNQTIGTGKIKPYVDKKHFFQELKNPPKKVLNDLVTEAVTSSQPISSTPMESLSNNSLSNFANTFETPSLSSATNTAMNVSSNSIYNNDPFGEDPFDQTDPFADADFGKSDFKVFENELSDYKLFNNGSTSGNKASDLCDNTTTTTITTGKSTATGLSGDLSQLFKADFEFNASSTSTTRKLFDHQSFDMSSESEAPDPPPRPTNTLIKPPPLPPKKQNTIDLATKPPPRPPQECHYDYMDKYESGRLNNASKDENPPLPVPARKPQNKFESDFVVKEDEYLTPIGLLPPPKSTRKSRSESPNVAAASVVAPAPMPLVTMTENITAASQPANTGNNFNDLSLDTLDITLSQLTLSGLNELASKLNIPASQLSNMTLVQLTSYLSNFIKNKNNATNTEEEEEAAPTASMLQSPPPTLPSPITKEKKIENTETADFADFNQFNSQLERHSPQIMSAPSYDRYAAFRELLQKEDEVIKTTKIGNDTHFDTAEEEEEEENENDSVENEENENQNDLSGGTTSNTNEFPTFTIESTDTTVLYRENVSKETEMNLHVDRYAALREISMVVDATMRSTEDIDTIEEDEEEQEDEPEELDAEGNDEPSGELDAQEDNHLQTIDECTTEQNNMNDDKNSSIENDLNMPIADVQIIDDVKNDNTTTFNTFETVQNIQQLHRQSHVKDEIAQSGSLSDVVSGSSPEIDDNRDTSKKDTTGESWAIFNQPSLIAEDVVKDSKAIHSEEGVSPWSSDSKEFGNGSPTGGWRGRRDSGSGDRWSGGGGGVRGSGRSQEGWWDTSAEPEAPSYNRRSTDSFDDEYYETYDRPRRARRQGSAGGGGSGSGTWCGPPTGGHSSSSRDVSPWEEEPRRRDGRQSWSSRHSSRQSFERHNERWRHADSWDEEDDYEYEDERFHWHSERQHPREIDEWEERRLRAGRIRRDVDRERWCCPDYDAKDVPEPLSRYSSGRWSNPDRRKHDDRYYARDSQESPWEDEYGNEIEPHYLTARRTRIRPSSATEMDRKTGEIKSRGQFHMGHGSDGERDRRYKSNRRSKSRDSQYSEPPRLSRQLDPATLRGPLRKQHQKFDDYEVPPPPAKALLKDPLSSQKKMNTIGGRKSRAKESLKTEETNTFPRKSRVDTLAKPPPAQQQQQQQQQLQRSMFENDFVQFEDFATESQESRWYKKPAAPKQHVPVGTPTSHTAAPSRTKQKSLFEDDFSPTDKEEKISAMGSGESTQFRAGGSPVKDDASQAAEASDGLGANNFDARSNNSKKRFNRMSQLESNLKKSESVNIFARENDPFDDAFFSGENANGDSKWAHNFNDNRT